MSVESKLSFSQDLWDRRFFEFVIDKSEQLFDPLLLSDSKQPNFFLESAKIVQARGKSDVARPLLHEIFQIRSEADSSSTLYKDALAYQGDINATN